MLAYYLHENSDSVFVDHHGKDFGPMEHKFIHKIGLCIKPNDIMAFKRTWVRRRNNGKFKDLKISMSNICLEKPYLPF